MTDDAARIRALTAATQALERTEKKLQESIDDLRESVDEQLLRNAHKTSWSIAAAAFAVVLSGLLVVGYLKMVSLVDQQAQTTESLAGLIGQQEVIRSQVLCPLYSVFLGSYQPTTRAAGTDRDTYEQNFAQMRAQYAVLRCSGPVVPPRIDLPPPAK